MAYTVGVAGISGSGKGTACDLFGKHLQLWGLKTDTVSSDDCYKDFGYLSAEVRAGFCTNLFENFDNPEFAVDERRLLTYIKYSKKGTPFGVPYYDFSTHSYDRTKNPQKIESNLDVVFFEGFPVLYFPEVVQELDYRIFVITNPVLAALRRLPRDVEKRGRQWLEAIRQISTTVVPMQEKYTLPCVLNANDIIDWRVNEANKSPKEIKKELVILARQRALIIYEKALKKPLLPELSLEGLVIDGIDGFE